MRSRTCLATLPRVLLPVSPYAAASGSAPQPAPSSTMTMTREKTGISEAFRRQSPAGDYGAE
jgi:hypothetical protein